MVKGGEVECPLGCGSHKIRLPAGVAAASLSTCAEWARHIPLNRGLLTSMRHSRSMLQMVLQQSGTGVGGAGGSVTAALHTQLHAHSSIRAHACFKSYTWLHLFLALLAMQGQGASEGTVVAQ